MRLGKYSAFAVSVAAFTTAALPARAVLLYATSGNDLARFDSGATGVVTSVPVSGLQGGETLVGIDVRPANQLLYGLGSSSRLYTINPLTGVATQVGAAGAFTLNGTSFGVDFNPVPDRLRVISNTGQNLRLDPNNAVAYNNKGAALFGLRQYKEAIAAYDQAIHLTPGYALAYYNKSNALSSLKKHREARQAYESAKRLGYKS